MSLSNMSDSEHLQHKDQKDENTTEGIVDEGDECEKKKQLYLDHSDPNNVTADLTTFDDVNDDERVSKAVDRVDTNCELREGCRGDGLLPNMQIEGLSIGVESTYNAERDNLSKAIDYTSVVYSAQESINSNRYSGICKLERPEPQVGISSRITSKYNPNSPDYQNKIGSYSSDHSNFLVETRLDNTAELFQDSSDTNNLAKTTDIIDNVNPESLQMFDNLQSSKELSEDNKDLTSKGKVGGRREEVKELLDNICRLKSELVQGHSSIVIEKLNSRRVHLGMRTQQSLYEELLLYLLEHRDLTEDIFECDNFEEIKFPFVQSDIDSNSLIRIKGNNTEFCEHRKTVFDGILDFAEKRFSISQVFTDKLKNSGKKCPDDNIRPFNAYYELLSHDCIVFFDSILTDNTDFKSFMAPVQEFNSRIDTLCINPNYKLNKIKNEMDLISTYSIQNISEDFEQRATELKFATNNFEGSCFEILKNDPIHYFQSEMTDNTFTINNFSNNVRANSNGAQYIKLKFDLVRHLKRSLVNNIFRNKFQNIQNRLNYLDKDLNMCGYDNHESEAMPILNKLFSIENMLKTITPELCADNISSQRICMEESLLYGFKISETRKSDLKKISNLVRSKVSSVTGRRCSKHETDECNSELNEIEICRMAENERIKSLLEDLASIKHQGANIDFNELLSISTKLVEKDMIIRYFLSMLECINRCEKIHMENLMHLERIHELTNTLIGTIKDNICTKKVNEAHFST
ncbi:hypothetical protein OJ253_3205 [Cryptosporidium canis]|uniref:Uncharacterized protein n=1 Tax=Cryptosporidium canis TaxID=195482 RepID=A0A9D5DH19_9CRYT|nr:hypothetical protein OJ253_3205 [Cryptosporidium canis]